MIETPKAYSRRQLISVAEVASTLAESRNIAGLEAVQQLAEAVRVGMLCPDLYPPHQQWQHGGDSERIGKPSGNSSGIWHSLAVASAKRHMSDKDDFNYPPAASTWHVLADDVMKFSGHHSIPNRVRAALQELAARYKPELAAPPMKAEASRILAGESDDAPAEQQAAHHGAPGSNKVWTDERKAELRTYRAAHGTKKAAEHFGISEQRVRQLLPSKKPKATPFAGLGNRK